TITQMLGGDRTDCPTLTKYAYLLDTSPAGKETIDAMHPARPLAFDWSLSDGGVGLKMDSVQFVVTAPDGSRSMPRALQIADHGNGVYTGTAVVTRNDFAPLGIPGTTQAGTFVIEVQATDVLGNGPATLSRCWIHQPLGVPLQELPGTGPVGIANG